MKILKAYRFGGSSRYLLKVSGDIGSGDEIFDFVLDPSDPHGLAPDLRLAMEDDVASGSLVIEPHVFQASAEKNIIAAPSLGFGGPTAKELFNGNR